MRSRPLSAATNLTDQTDQTDQTETDGLDYTITVEPDRRSLQSANNDVELRSCTSDLYELVHRYGRTYHNFRAGAYPFPNDAMENERLDMQHIILKVLFRGHNWFAPINRLPLKRPKKVLDIGCGTGTWCIQMAKEFPRSHIIGMDLSPIQPQCISRNCDFWMDDIRDRLWWETHDQFDYIHTRMSLGIFKDFREIIQKGFNNLEPGGWMESQELYSKVFCDDNTMPPDWPMLKWSLDQDEAAMKLGTPLRIANKLKLWYQQAGFVDVKEEIFRIPINEWAKEDRFKMFGKFMAANVQAGLYGWTVDYFHRAWGWNEAQVRVECASVHKSLYDRSVHAYFKIYVVYGRKPHVGEAPSQVPKPDHWPTPDQHDDDADSLY